MELVKGTWDLGMKVVPSELAKDDLALDATDT